MQMTSFPQRSLRPVRWNNLHTSAFLDVILRHIQLFNTAWQPVLAWFWYLGHLQWYYAKYYLLFSPSQIHYHANSYQDEVQGRQLGEISCNIGRHLPSHDWTFPLYASLSSTNTSTSDVVTKERGQCRISTASTGLGQFKEIAEFYESVHDP